jgi:hypothetical protein
VDDDPSGTKNKNAHVVFIFAFYSYIETGSACAEGYHKHLTEKMHRSVMALNKLVDFLAGEDNYWQEVIETPHLWGAKKKQIEVAKLHHLNKRRHLAYYIERDTDSERVGGTQDIDITSLLEDFENSNNGEDGSDSDHVVNCADALSPQPQPKVAQPAPPTTSNGTNKKFMQCPTCKKIKASPECSFGLCKSCCSQVPERCKILYHQRDKKSTRGAYVPSTNNTTANLKLVEEAISNKTDLWISYDMKSNGKGPCKITPWQVTQNNKDHLVDTLCHIANTNHQFYVHRMIRVEDHNWNALLVPLHSQCSQQTQLLPVSPTVQRKCDMLFLFFTNLKLMCIQRFLHLWTNGWSHYS